MSTTNPYPNTVAQLPGKWAYLYKPQEQLQNDGTGWTCTTGFVTDYTNLINFVTAIGGIAQVVQGSTASTIRILPLQHPIYYALYAKAIRTEAFGTPDTTGGTSPVGTATWNMWNKVRVIVDFGYWPWPTIGDQAYMSLDMSYSSSYVTVPGTALTFPSDGSPIKQDAGVFVAETGYVLSLFQCPTLNDGACDGIAGCVNSATFLNKAPGYLRFDGCQSNIAVSVGGVISYTRKLLFTYRSVPWNQVLRPNGIWEAPVTPGGSYIYNSASFTPLLN